MLHRDFTPAETEKNKKKFFEEGKNFIDKMLTHTNKKWKNDPKIVKKRAFTRYDVKVIANHAVKFDNWVVLQKMNPIHYVNADGNIDPYREKRIF